MVRRVTFLLESTPVAANFSLNLRPSKPAAPLIRTIDHPSLPSVAPNSKIRSRQSSPLIGEVRIVAITGRFVLSLRRLGRTRVYSSAVVEKHLAVPDTTRKWNTIATNGKVLSS